MKLSLLAIPILIISLLASCSEESISDSRIAMGTLITATLPEVDEAAFDEIFSSIYQTDREISRYTEGSFIYEINENAGIAPVAVPEDIFTLISRAIDMACYTDGLFNPAIGPLSELWGMGTENARVPSEEEIEAVLPLLDYRMIVLDEEESSVYLPMEGMALDLGGVGKGFAADRVREALEDMGIERALVNLGGNLLVHGDGWRIGIRDPRRDGSYTFMTLSLGDEMVITSGGYMRYVEKDGVRYHHILDSSTGYPYDSDILSATAITPDGTLGDMLSTVFFAAGSERALEIAEDLDVRVILLLEDGTVIDSDGADGDVAVVEE